MRLCDRHNATREERMAAMKYVAADVVRLLDEGELAEARGAAYELDQRLAADLFMRQMVEDRPLLRRARADKIVSNTKTEER